MSKLKDYNYPDQLKYIILEPYSFFWVKKISEDDQRKGLILELGFPEIITKNLVKDKLKFGFRSENLQLRKNKPFLRLLAKNKMFEFLAPFKCNWSINPNIKNNNFRFLDFPYEEYIIKCFNIENQDIIDTLLKNISELDQEILISLEKDLFKDCIECPDIFQGSITRRKNF